MNFLPYLYLAGGSAVFGWLIFYIFFKFLPKRFQAIREAQKNEILADAKKHAEERIQGERQRAEIKHTLMLEELASDIEDQKADLKEKEEDLELRHRTFQMEESGVQKLEAAAEKQREKVESRAKEYKEVLDRISENQVSLIESLGQRADLPPNETKESLTANIIESHQIESQKVLKFLSEELDSSARRRSARMLGRAMARYAPEFYWPKSVNFVELPSAKIVEKVSDHGAQTMEILKEHAGIEVDLLAEKENAVPIIKLAGGAGINREAVRLSFNELLSKHHNQWDDQAIKVYDRHRAILEKQAVELGRKAVNQLQLHNIHPEIQRLVGYLNWRTSYRQNQWHHTVEVATLAGILGTELGLDANESKRVGLMHDIGKAIDYRIEGSHAVISGDYADRYGENRLICDTVMSHHNDLNLETALSYVLKTADTLSGARPGARVNLEEGYQMRLSGIDAAVRSFPGVIDVAIMNGAREVHVEVNHKKVRDKDLEEMSKSMAEKITEEVAFPGEIKILISRIFEATSVA
jgi:ribonuclease Y